MKKQVLQRRWMFLLSIILITTGLKSQTLNEGFESGLPSTASSTAQNYTLSSGIWTILNAQSTTRATSGIYGLQLNGGSANNPTYAAAPSVNAPSTVTFKAAASAKSKIKVQKSVNGGPYSDLSTINVTTTYSGYSVTVNETSTDVRIRFANAATPLLYVDDATINGATASSPAITTSVSSLPDFGSVTVGATSPEKTYTVSASALSPLNGNITLTAPTAFEVSLTSGSGFASSVTIAYSNGSLASTTIYIRFKPTAAQAYNGSVSHAGGSASTVYVSVSGTGVNSSTSAAKYVSPTGNDANAGTIDAPFKTIAKAVSVVNAGDTIFLRGGRHYYTTTTSIAKSGTSTSKLYLFAYSTEKPILDFSGMAVSSSNRGINFSGSYWHLKGIDFYKAGDNGMFMNGSNNIIELCNFYENNDTGFQLGGGASNNQIINCDAYYNADPSQGNADGFAPKLDVGSGNIFKGCRAWQNSDDGWDGLLSSGFGQNPSTTYENCWVFMNGYLKDGTLSSGNGNGLKMGGNLERHDAKVTNCLAAFNKAKGFDQNNNAGSMILYNCTGYKNGGPASKPNFGLGNNDPAQGEVMVVKNSISYMGATSDAFRAVAELTYNSWQNGIIVSDADFASVDSIGLRNPRKADGSLPDINFMHLAIGSDMIDAGTNVGLAYNGIAPDLGCFETGASAKVSSGGTAGKVKNLLNVDVQLNAFPNPFSSISNIRFRVEQTAPATVKVMNAFGQTVTVLFNGKANADHTYTVPFQSASLPSGMYYVVIESESQKLNKVLLLNRK